MSNISCIIANYNNCKYLTKAIESALNQTLHINEIIIADDASTDSSRDLISTLANKHPTIRPIFREHNIGVSANRDLAIRAAKNDLITTLDSDDWYHPNKIKNEFDLINTGNNDIAFSNITLFYENIGKKLIQDLSTFPTCDNLTQIKWIASRKGLIPRDMLLTKKAYIETGGFRHNLRIYEDWDFKIRLANTSFTWGYTGKEGTFYRKTGVGLSAQTPKTHFLALLSVLNKNKDLLVKRIGLFGYINTIRKLSYLSARHYFSHIKSSRK